MDIVLSDHDSPGVSVNCNNHSNGYDSNNESLMVHGADLELHRNYTFTNTLTNTSRSEKIKLIPNSPYQSGLNAIKKIKILTYYLLMLMLDYTSQDVFQGIMGMSMVTGITGVIADDTRLVFVNGIDTVTVIISGSNDNGNDSGIKSVSDVGIGIGWHESIYVNRIKFW